MKPSSTFPPFRWWNSLALVNRLFLAFTGLFLYCLIVMSVYLNMAVQMVEVNQDARYVFEQTRPIYQLRDLTQRYQLALNQYKINSSPDALRELTAFSASIDDAVINLSAGLDEIDSQDLQTYQDAKAAVSEQFEQIVAAVDREDWQAVAQLDQQVYNDTVRMDGAIDAITQRSQEIVAALDDWKTGFFIVLALSLIAGVPFFVVLAGLVSLVIYAQINRPLEQVRQSSDAILSDHLDAGPMEGLAAREDEVGLMAREFIKMVGLIGERKARLEQEAGEIKAKIR